MTIYRKWLCGNAPIRDIDRDTGLLFTSIDGLVGHASEPGRIEGHNDHVAQYIRWNGLPENSLKPWERELFNLARFFDDRSQHATPTRLLAGAAAVVSPDGRNSVRLVGDVLEGAQRLVGVEIAAGPEVLQSGCFPWFDTPGDIDLLWGPAGSRFAIVRSRTAVKEYYTAYDLRRGRSIRDEWRVPREAVNVAGVSVQ